MLCERNSRNASSFVVARIETLQISGYLVKIGLSLLPAYARFEPCEYA
jgi:hypothetical protein